MTDRIKSIAVTMVFVLMLIIILLVNFLKKDIEISVTERRKLAMFPKFSISKLIDGSFIDQLENYTMDQFVNRDSFRSLKTFIELNIFGKQDVKGVYEYNGMIIKQEYPLNEQSVLNATQKINKIKLQYLDDSNKIYYTIVPDKNYYVENEHLKMDYSKIEQIMIENLEKMEYIKIFDCLKLEDYYYTDTHWKQESLKKVLEKIAIQMDFKDRLNTSFDLKEITNFNGVYSGQLQVKTKQDTIKVLTNNVIENCKVYNYETNKYTQIYDLEKINSNDKYDIYLSGATPLLTIENNQANTDKELIIFRDSFGSSLVPLFTEAYKKITLIDTRYIIPDLLKNYVEFEGKDVLFMYSTLVLNSSETLR